MSHPPPPRPAPCARAAGLTLCAIGLWATGACATPKFGNGALEEHDAEPAVAPVDAAAAMTSEDAQSAHVESDASSRNVEDAQAAARDGKVAALDGAAMRDVSDAAEAEAPRPPTDAAQAAARDSAASHVDASTPAEPTPGPASWIGQALGLYAMDVDAFGYDGMLVTHYSALFLADLQRDGDGYQLVTTRCRVVAQTNIASMTMRDPEKLAPHRHRLLIEGETFSTERLDMAEGYAPALPAECANKLGELVPKLAHQSWLPTSCRCGGELVPARDDCRVLDPDEDGQPGYSFDFMSKISASRYAIYAASLDESRLVQGARRPDGTLHARYDATSGSMQYGCRPSTCADLSGPVAWCSSDLSRVELTPLSGRPAPAGGWSCAAITAREGEIFPMLPPPWPPRCEP